MVMLIWGHFHTIQTQLIHKCEQMWNSYTSHQLTPMCLLKINDDFIIPPRLILDVATETTSETSSARAETRTAGQSLAGTARGAPAAARARRPSMILPH